MTYEDQIHDLKTAEFAEGEECIRRDDASRIASEADAEVARLRAENAHMNNLACHYRGELYKAQEEITRLQYGIAALREQWQARYDAWKVEFDEEMQKAGRAERSLILAGQRYAMACVLEELDALFPPESSA